MQKARATLLCTFLRRSVQPSSLVFGRRKPLQQGLNTGQRHLGESPVVTYGQFITDRYVKKICCAASAAAPRHSPRNAVSSNTPDLFTARNSILDHLHLIRHPIRPRPGSLHPSYPSRRRRLISPSTHIHQRQEYVESDIDAGSGVTQRRKEIRLERDARLKRRRTCMSLEDEEDVG